MPNMYHCDGCGKMEQAHRKGLYQLLPTGWHVGFDAPLSGRLVELYACSAACIPEATKRCLPARLTHLKWKQIIKDRGPDVLRIA